MPLKINSDLPALKAVPLWYNGQPGDFQNSPVLVHFWSVSCGICSEQMPQVVKWRETYTPQGLAMVGIHMPRSEKDLDPERVQEAVKSYGLTYPVAVDNEHTLVDLFDNTYVPAFYVFDRQHHLRLYQAGEKGLPLVERAIERALARSEE